MDSHFIKILFIRLYCQKVDISSKKSILSNIDFGVEAIYIFSGKTGTKAGFDEYETYIDVNDKSLYGFFIPS